MKVIFFANTDWYLYNFRLALARHVSTLGADVVMLSPPGEFSSRFAQHGLRWLAVEMDRASLNPLSEALTLRRLAATIKLERPDLLHNFTVKCAVYGSVAARIAQVPAVVNAVAGMGFVYSSDTAKARLLRPVVNTLMRNTLGRKNSRLILQNPDDADAFTQSRIVPDSQIRLIRSSGVNTERFKPSPHTEPRRALRVLFAARLLREKGIHEFVSAARILGEQGRDFEFLVAGSIDPGNPRSVAASEVQEWQEEGIVRVLGHVDDMAGLLRSIDVMALPSYYREGVPRSLTEAAASGVALVTTNLPGCREVVRNSGVDGLHVLPRDVESLAAALATLDDDRDLLSRLGQQARQRALEEFDEKLVIKNTVEVYNELLPADLRLGPSTGVE